MDCKSPKLILSSVLMVVFVLDAVAVGPEEQPTLKLVNVVFRHGDRAPNIEEKYPNDPYLNASFYPVFRGGLTNGGKRRAYRLGQDLKSRYGEFLGSVYEPWAIEARSSDYDRTKMTLQLVLSGLYPPAPIQKWNDDLPWQPIPASYRRSSEDMLFEPELCPKYLAELDRVRRSPEVLAKSARFSRLVEFLRPHTGSSYLSNWDLFILYHTFVAEEALNLALPDWAAEVYPYGELWNATVLEYEIASYNQELKRLNGGMFVRKISEDLTACRSGILPVGRRMFLYSGHETNINSFLIALGVYEPHVPRYSSAIMVELWELKGQYFVKVLHYLGIPPTVVTKRIPGCEELCPLDTFLVLMKSVTPLDSDLICTEKASSSPVTPISVLATSGNKLTL